MSFDFPDLFVVLLPSIAQDVLQTRGLALENLLSENPHISFSYGLAWSERACNVQALLKVADSRMYAKKQLFYAEHAFTSAHDSAKIHS